MTFVVTTPLTYARAPGRCTSMYSIPRLTTAVKALMPLFDSRGLLYPRSSQQSVREVLQVLTFFRLHPPRVAFAARFPLARAQ